jgi:hypothetical protein
VPTVTLPPGCTGLDLQDGTRYDADRNGRVHLADRHSDAVAKGWYGQSGVMTATAPHRLGTRTGRWCVTCTPARLWNAWNTQCPRCGSPTSTEKEHS